MSFSLTYKGWSHDPGLQIIQADVVLEIDGEIVIDEPLCIDVGLPALLLSAIEDVFPDRWAGVNAWQKAPFLCCGCGDPECRAFSFTVTHQNDAELLFTEVEESAEGEPRKLGEYTVNKAEYIRQVRGLAEQFLAFTAELDYRPLFADTTAKVRELLAKLPPASSL